MGENIVFNYAKLRGKIVEVYGSQQKLAKALGLSNEGLSKKMRGKVPFKQKEMVVISDLLGFPVADMDKYFFCREGSVNRTDGKGK